MSESDKARIKSVDKAIDVLEALRDADNREMTLEDVSACTGLSRTTAWRLLSTLKAREYVSYDVQTREYSLGAALLRIAKVAYVKSDLSERVKPILRELVQTTGETANFAVLLDGSTIVFMDQIKSTYLVHATPQLGVRLPAHCTAVGKAILAFLDPAEVQRIVKQTSLSPLTAKSITSLPELEKELIEIKLRGFAIDDEETEIGGTCIGVAILDPGGHPIAGISVTGPSSRMRRSNLNQIGSVVRQAVHKLSANAVWDTRAGDDGGEAQD